MKKMKEKEKNETRGGETLTLFDELDVRLFVSSSHPLRAFVSLTSNKIKFSFIIVSFISKKTYFNAEHFNTTSFVLFEIHLKSFFLTQSIAKPVQLCIDLSYPYIYIDNVHFYFYENMNDEILNVPLSNQIT